MEAFDGFVRDLFSENHTVQVSLAYAQQVCMTLLLGELASLLTWKLVGNMVQMEWCIEGIVITFFFVYHIVELTFIKYLLCLTSSFEK